MSLTDVVAYIGTATGISSLVIHFVKFIREKPKLKIELEEGHHWINKNTEKSQPKSFVRIGLRVDNIGDRGTRITSYSMRFICKTPKYINYSIAEPLTERVYVKPHDSAFIEFIHEVHGEIADSIIGCLYILQHTHGKVSITAHSQKSSQPVSTSFHGYTVQTLP